MLAPKKFIDNFQASFLARLVGPDLATASAHNSMKSISGNSPGIELAARHCFFLEDPPNDTKEPAVLHRYLILNASYIPVAECL